MRFLRHTAIASGLCAALLFSLGFFSALMDPQWKTYFASNALYGALCSGLTALAYGTCLIVGVGLMTGSISGMVECFRATRVEKRHYVLAGLFTALIGILVAVATMPLTFRYNGDAAAAADQLFFGTCFVLIVLPTCAIFTLRTVEQKQRKNSD